MSVDAESELKARVTQVLAEEVLPALKLEGLELEVQAVREGIAEIRFLGTCTSCPSTLMTLIMGIEQELRKRVPEVEFLEALP